LNIEPLFWNSWKGKILRAVVLDGVYEKSEMLKKVGLTEKQLETALDELLEAGLLNHNEGKSRFWSNSKELSKEYIEFFKEMQITLIDWLHE
jgi:DNA-binding HxlR family transcriptional regulator